MVNLFLLILFGINSRNSISHLDSHKQELPKDSRIVNGDVIPSLYGLEWLICFGKKKDPSFCFCGGSLINSRTVLTAAHCFYNTAVKPEDSLVLHGARDLQDPEEIQEATKYNFTIIFHPDYDPDLVRNDIAIAILDEPINLYKENYILLDDERKGRIFRKNVTALGWGKTYSDEAAFRPGLLRKADLKIASLPVSKAHLNWFMNIKLFDTNICTRSRHGSQIDTCQGDSGGPLISYDCGVFTLVGITSFGFKCGLAYVEGVYTSVSDYLHFIRENMAYE